jgi:hypothetical protein
MSSVSFLLIKFISVFEIFKLRILFGPPFRPHLNAPDFAENEGREGNEISSEQDFADFYNDDLDELKVGSILNEYE